MALSLKQARLCLDCDWLTAQTSCSQCGGHGTGLHVGLNDAAPDLEASIWLSWKWQVPRDAIE